MQENDIKTYFLKNAPQIPGVTTRAVNALIRGGVYTMDVLCSKSESELRKVRNMGEKSLLITLAMKGMYASENTLAEDTV